MDDPDERAEYEAWQADMHRTIHGEPASHMPPGHAAPTVLMRFLAGESIDMIGAVLYPGTLVEARGKTEAALREALMLVLPSAPVHHVTLMVIGEVVATVYSVPLNNLRNGNKRDATMTIARGIFAIVAHEYQHSYTTIGEYLGGRDHSTITHARDRAQALLAQDTPASNAGKHCLNAVRATIQLRITQANMAK